MNGIKLSTLLHCMLQEVEFPPITYGRWQVKIRWIPKHSRIPQKIILSYIVYVASVICNSVDLVVIARYHIEIDIKLNSWEEKLEIH